MGRAEAVPGAEAPSDARERMMVNLGEAGAPDSTVNWLPSPTDAFRLILRTCLPALSILDATRLPPALVGPC
jgi:hypothetical protein